MDHWTVAVLGDGAVRKTALAVQVGSLHVLAAAGLIFYSLHSTISSVHRHLIPSADRPLTSLYFTEVHTNTVVLMQYQSLTRRLRLTIQR